MTTMKAAATPRHRPSIWKPFKLDVGSDMSAKFRKNSRTHVTIGQALTLAALSAAGAAVLTALIAVYCLSNSVPDIYSDHLVASTTSGAISHHSLLRTAESQLVELVYEKEATVYDDSDETRLEVSPMNMKEASYVMLPNTLPDRYLEDDGVRPHIAWLMSFPNRYIACAASRQSPSNATQSQMTYSIVSHRDCLFSRFVISVALPLPFT
jgi:hypothetical protein